jgi:hypothetical protein
MAAKARNAAITQLDTVRADSPLLVVATGSFVGEKFDCPTLGTFS